MLGLDIFNDLDHLLNRLILKLSLVFLLLWCQLSMILLLSIERRLLIIVFFHSLLIRRDSFKAAHNVCCFCGVCICTNIRIIISQTFEWLFIESTLKLCDEVVWDKSRFCWSDYSTWCFSESNRRLILFIFFMIHIIVFLLIKSEKEDALIDLILILAIFIDFLLRRSLLGV